MEMETEKEKNDPQKSSSFNANKSFKDAEVINASPTAPLAEPESITVVDNSNTDPTNPKNNVEEELEKAGDDDVICAVDEIPPREPDLTLPQLSEEIDKLIIDISAAADHKPNAAAAEAAAAALENEEEKDDGDHHEKSNAAAALEAAAAGDEKSKAAPETAAGQGDDDDDCVCVDKSNNNNNNNINNNVAEEAAAMSAESWVSSVEIFCGMVESMVIKYEAGDVKFGEAGEEDSSLVLIEAVDRMHRLTNAVRKMPAGPQMASYLNHTTSVLQRVMCFFEEELRRRLLEEDDSNDDTTTKKDHSSSSNNNNHNHNHGKDRDRDKDCRDKDKDSPFKALRNKQSSFNSKTHQGEAEHSSEAEAEADQEAFPGFTEEAVSAISRIAKTMIAAGYETECCQVYSLSRRHAFKEALNKLGLERTSIDDVQKMQWESLNGEAATWIKVVNHCTSVLFPGERRFCEAVFGDAHASTHLSHTLFTDLARAVVIQLLNFAEAVSMTKRSAEKIFRFLDMYETIRDLHLPPTSIDGYDNIHPADNMRSEIVATACRLGEAAVGNFCDLENSIKSDTGKTAVPNGALHPLTRYTMNYLKVACEYRNSLEQVFLQHQRMEGTSRDDADVAEVVDPAAADINSSHGGGGGRPLVSENSEHVMIRNNMPPSIPNSKHKNSPDPTPASTCGSINSNTTGVADNSPFAAEVGRVMDLLDANLEAKSRLYKDSSLRSIFLMNNGRYILQKIKGSAEIHEVMGNTWSRKRSSDLRQHHKNYQRETWVRVLGCLKDDGLTVNGKLQKPLLKERFKSFNAMFEEIHRTQSTWVVSDEQLQSELRVSISALVIPAYRSFLGRFQQFLTPGRQTEKYIKLHPDDIETAIEELFDGNPANLTKRKN